MMRPDTVPFDLFLIGFSIAGFLYLWWSIASGAVHTGSPFSTERREEAPAWYWLRVGVLAVAVVLVWISTIDALSAGRLWAAAARLLN